jgi:hypothetical protein
MTSLQEQHPARLFKSQAASFLRLSVTSALFFGLGFSLSSGQGNMRQQQVASRDLRVTLQRRSEIHPIEQFVQTQSIHFVACGLVKQEQEPIASSLTGPEACTVPDQPQLPERRVRIA